ncbi:MAG TPA: hypothetical protein PLQ45_04640, partial [Anaerohalosphaeraceae bacterium]|nr:hypothetical protein [Anaerohalosphaeraceae bacterium]
LFYRIKLIYPVRRLCFPAESIISNDFSINFNPFSFGRLGKRVEKFRTRDFAAFTTMGISYLIEKIRLFC